MDKEQIEILKKAGSYIVDHIYSTPKLWKELERKDILTPEMLDDIEMCNGKNKVYKLLDILRTRGPVCFPKFLHVLEDCGYGHVAKHIRDIENDKRPPSRSGERRKTDERKLLEEVTNICVFAANCITNTTSDINFSEVKSAIIELRGKLSQFGQDVASMITTYLFALETLLDDIAERRDAYAKLSHSIYLIKEARESETAVQRKLTTAQNEKAQLMEMKDFMKKNIADMEGKILNLQKSLREAKKNTDEVIDSSYRSRRRKKCGPISRSASYVNSGTADDYTDSSDSQERDSTHNSNNLARYDDIEKTETVSPIRIRDNDILSPINLTSDASMNEAETTTVTPPVRRHQNILGHQKKLHVNENILPEPIPLSDTSIIPSDSHKSANMTTSQLRISVGTVKLSIQETHPRKLPDPYTCHTHPRKEGKRQKEKTPRQQAQDKLKKLSSPRKKAV